MKGSRRTTIIAAALVLVWGGAALAEDLMPIEELGKFLFFDNNLSTPTGQACAVCHGPAVGFTGPISEINAHGAVYPGAVPSRFGDRKPPTTAYAGDSPVLHYDDTLEEWIGGMFWDGRATGWTLGDPLAEQALGPFLNPLEQNNPNAFTVVTKVARSGYAGLFKAVWGEGSLPPGPTSDATREAPPEQIFDYRLAYERIGRSIAAYERSPDSTRFTSRFDEYWTACIAAGNDPEACGKAEGDKAVLDPLAIFTDQEFDGLIEFGEYCSACHVSHEFGPGGTPPLFTDFTYVNIGSPKNPENPFYTMPRRWNPDGRNFVDQGLGGFLKRAGYPAEIYESQLGKHKVPTLRNVDRRPEEGFVKAYGHNGFFKSLEQIVHFYNTRDVPEENWPPPELNQNVSHQLLEGVPLGNLELDQEAEDAIVAFLKTLSDGFVLPGS